MKASELRIGNYISPLGIGYTKVEGYYDNFIATEDFSDRKVEDFNPIPLTEEWLLKFGFYKSKYGIWSSESTFFQIEESTNGYINSINGGEYTNGVEFKYVHQLQNIYFALTGKEL